jgi:mannose-1-phosphate guanylyltransferase
MNRRCSPPASVGSDAAARGFPSPRQASWRSEYPGIRKVSIDYALMEKARNVVVADGSLRLG